MANEMAEPGELFVCLACGKTSVWSYGFDDKNRDVNGELCRYASPGWDESCMLNCKRVKLDQLVYTDASRKEKRVTGIKPFSKYEYQILIESLTSERAGLYAARAALPVDLMANKDREINDGIERRKAAVEGLLEKLQKERDA